MTHSDHQRRVRELEHALDRILARPEPLPEGLLERSLAIPESAEASPRLRALRLFAAGAAAAVAAVVLLLWGASLSTTSPRSPSETALATPTLPRPQEDLRAVLLAALRRSDADPTALLAARGDRALSMLRRLARESDPDIARTSIRWLGLVPQSASLPVLEEAVLHADRRVEALRALGALGDARAIRSVAPFLDDDIHFDAALDALTQIRGDGASRVLAQRLERSIDAAKQARLIDALGVIASPHAASTLLALSKDPIFAEQAWDALRTHQVELLPHVLLIAQGWRAAAAEQALLTLDRLAPASAVPALAALLSDRARRGLAATALARIDTPAAAEALLGCRAAADVRTAFRFAGPGIAGHLRGLCAQAPRHEKVHTIDLLGLCGDVKAVSMLERLAEDPLLAPHALTALGRIADDGSIAALTRLAEQPRSRRSAVEALGWTGSRAAVPVLARLATDDPRLRLPALQALARIPDPSAVKAIVLLGASRRGSGPTARALRGMDRSVVVPALQTMLEGEHDRDARVALRAIDPVLATHPH